MPSEDGPNASCKVSKGTEAREMIRYAREAGEVLGADTF